MYSTHIHNGPDVGLPINAQDSAMYPPFDFGRNFEPEAVQPHDSLKDL